MNTASSDIQGSQPASPLKIGLALGGGGARGLAHVLVLEVFDELGIKPYRIAGTSIGAILGALYSAGHTAREIRELVESLLQLERKELAHALVKFNVFKWIELIDPKLGKGGLIDADHFMGYLHKAIRQDNFKGLSVPLQAVAADYWTGEQIILDSGELLPAIKASMALPDIFSPVRIGQRLLIDGGAVNPLPYDILPAECNLVVAIDVTGTLQARTDVEPSFFESIFRTARIMGQAIVAEKLKRQMPDIYIKPDIKNIRTLEFGKYEEIYRQSAPAKEEFKQRLTKLLAELGS
jgi:NTE family protein